jgi:hypothetical protein
VLEVEILLDVEIDEEVDDVLVLSDVLVLEVERLVDVLDDVDEVLTEVLVDVLLLVELLLVEVVVSSDANSCFVLNQSFPPRCHTEMYFMPSSSIRSRLAFIPWVSWYTEDSPAFTQVISSSTLRVAVLNPVRNADWAFVSMVISKSPVVA